MSKTDIDILGICEVRRGSEKIIHRKSGYIFLHYGLINGSRGVGFLIREGLARNIEEFYGVSDRIGVLKIKLKSNRYLTLIQIYAPTADPEEEEESDIFYADLINTLNNMKCSFRNTLIIMGDFNSQVGKKQSNETVVGNYGYGARNERGQKLVDFCNENGLLIMNTFFKKRAGKKWTWLSPNAVCVEL